MYQDVTGTQRARPAPAADGDSPHSILTDSPGRVALEDVVEIVRAHYGVRASVSRLSGERDDNFRVRTQTADWMLKIAHLKERRVVTEFQTAILEHLDGSEVRVPQLVRTIQGNAHEWVREGAATGRAVRMTTFLPGSSLRDAAVTPVLARTLGQTVAELDAALDGFVHAGTDVALLWDIQHARHTRELIAGCAEVDPDGLLRDRLDRFAEHVTPRLEKLPKQLIHNDFSPDNVLVEDQSVPTIGVLDFGDAVTAPRVVDLAVGAAYQVGVDDGQDFLDTVLDMVEGYHRCTPLRVDEVDLLYELIVARHVTAISIASWRAIRFPDNQDYIIRNTAVAWRRLRRLLAEGSDSVSVRIRKRCELA